MAAKLVVAEETAVSLVLHLRRVENGFVHIIRLGVIILICMLLGTEETIR